MLFDEAADPPELQQSDFGDPVVFFRDADEYLRRNRAEVWMAQAAERLEAHISARLGGINRLIVDLEEVLLQRSIQKTLNFLRVAETAQRLLVPLNQRCFRRPRNRGDQILQVGQKHIALSEKLPVKYAADDDGECIPPAPRCSDMAEKYC